MNNKYYTYAYLREDRTPYYIGKGKRNRAYNKHQKGISVPKDKSRIIFLKQNLTEGEAFRHETYLISVLGRKDLGTGILHNKTNGGDGASGATPSKDTRLKMSTSHLGKKLSEEHKKKISEAHKGKKISEELKRKLVEMNKGRKHTEETKRKWSEAKKGNQNLKGHKHSEETKRIIKEKSIFAEKWKCLETGFVSNPPNLTKYQRARGIDTSQRVKID